MIHKKNSFWILIFSLLPGAGEMYMGFMKQGISLMSAFFGVIFISAYLRIDAVIYMLPVVWCYSFFHVHNLKNLPDARFYELKDDYLIPESFGLGKIINKKGRVILATIFIFIGITILWNNVIVDGIYQVNEFMHFPYWIIDSIVYRIPQLVLAILLIIVGICLIKGKHNQLFGQNTKETDYSESNTSYHNANDLQSNDQMPKEKEQMQQTTDESDLSVPFIPIKEEQVHEN